MTVDHSSLSPHLPPFSSDPYTVSYSHIAGSRINIQSHNNYREPERPASTRSDPKRHGPTKKEGGNDRVLKVRLKRRLLKRVSSYNMTKKGEMAGRTGESIKSKTGSD